jgi:hypothetical protein
MAKTNGIKLEFQKQLYIHTADCMYIYSINDKEQWNDGKNLIYNIVTAG